MIPKLSIIIVNYRSASALEHCLRSLQVATDAALEVLVVDNSPTEATRAVLRNSGVHGHYYPQPENIGFAAAANLGLTQARGQFLCVVHPDVLFERHALDRLMDWMEQHPRTVVGPRERNPEGQVVTTAFPFITRRAVVGAHHPAHIWPRSWQPWLPWLIPEFRYARTCRTATEPMSVPVLSGSCLLMARSLWEEVGNFNEELSHFGLESEWFQRARHQGITAWYVPAAEIFHEHSATTRAEPWQLREGREQGRHWHAKRLGWLALLLLGVAIWIERRIEPRPK